MVTKTKAKADASTVRQTIMEILEAPRLTGTTTDAFEKLKQSRTIYERRLQEKNKLSAEIPLNVIPRQCKRTYSDFHAQG